MRALIARAVTAIAAAGWPVGICAVVGAVAGALIVRGASAAVAAAVGVLAGGLIGAGIAALIEWRQEWYWKLLVGGAAAVVIVVGGVLYAFGIRSGGNEGREVPAQSAPPPATRAALERRFAPVLLFNRRPAELFVPIDRPAYVGETQLKFRVGGTETLVDASPTVAKLPTSPCSKVPGCAYFLDVVGAEPVPPEPTAPAYHALQEQALAHHGAHQVVYAHVTQYDDSHDYAVQYWFLYLFNYRLNEHESDWEQITVHLTPQQRPIEAFYSAHVCGHVRSWEKMQHADGDHPLDYVAVGSHANYFKRSRPSVALTVVRVAKGRRVCVLERAFQDIADGHGTELRSGRDYELRELTGPIFAGSYGSGNYVGKKRRPDVLSDPRTRREWLDPLGSFGS